MKIGYQHSALSVYVTARRGGFSEPDRQSTIGWPGTYETGAGFRRDAPTDRLRVGTRWGNVLGSLTCNYDCTMQAVSYKAGRRVIERVVRTVVRKGRWPGLSVRALCRFPLNAWWGSGPCLPPRSSAVASVIWPALTL